ncbi:MAG: TldD/PmbA family protein [Thermoprotei archaeon]|nr:TldD/PmbA family protein [TACK group archaeon]
MSDEEVVLSAVRLAEGLGASYAEVRLEQRSSESLLARNGQVDATGYFLSSGVGIRVLLSGALGFSATNDLTLNGITRAVETAVKMARASSAMVRDPVRVDQSGGASAAWQGKVLEDPFDVPVDEKVKLMLDLDSSISGKEVAFPSRFLSLGFTRTEKLLANSFGEQVRSSVTRSEGFIFLTASHPQKGTLQKYEQLGEAAGWEAVKGWRLEDRLKDMTHALESNLMRAVKPDEGIMDVLLGSEVSGIVAHESAGHPAEADRIMGREAAQAGESYLKPSSLGMKVGSEHVTILDDPTIPGSYGYYEYDDEGVKARPRILIEKGAIKEFLHNRETAAAMGSESNGAARASSFDREPMVRMANTYFAPGDSSFDELVEGIRNGVYIKSFMEWNIDDVRWNERYVGLEAFSVRNGEIGEPVRSPVLEITTGKLFSSVDAAGREVRYYAATCGKGEPEQGVPVWTGGPELRLRGVRVTAR